MPDMKAFNLTYSFLETEFELGLFPMIVLVLDQGNCKDKNYTVKLEYYENNDIKTMDFD